MRVKLNEQGLVSITMTVIFILVISLTILGFSQVSNRNAREALDRHLASQAYYAAETGVNDVMNKVATLTDQGQAIPEQTQCSKDDTAGGYTRNSGRIFSSDTGVYYTCLLVKTKLTKLVYSNVSDTYVVVPINAEDTSTGAPTDINQTTIEWKPQSGNGAALGSCPAVGSNPKAINWTCPYGILRVDVLPLTNVTVASPDEANRAMMTVFVYPQNSGLGQVVYSATAPNNVWGGNGALHGVSAPGNCDAVSCKVTFTGLNFSSAYLRLSSVYVPSPSIDLLSDTGTDFTGSQVQIDATGKAQDVLRRVQVNASVTGSSSRNSSTYSNYALQSYSSLCKRYTAGPMSGNMQDAGACN